VKLLDRYLLREFTGPLFLGWGVLTFILLMDRLFLLIDLIINKGLRITVVGEILITSLPFIVASTVPMAVLLASVMVFGRLAQDNEFAAVKSSGTNPFRLSLPLIVYAAVLAGLMVFFNDRIMPEANHRVRNLMQDVSTKRPAVRILEGVFMSDFEGYTIFIGNKDERNSKIYNVTVFEKAGRVVPAIITAREGRLETTPDERYITMELFAGEIHESVGASYRKLNFDKHTINIPLNTKLIRQEREYRSDREMDLGRLFKKITPLNKEIAASRAQLARLKKDTLNPEVLKVKTREEQMRLDFKKKEKNRYLVEVNKKFSLPFGCLIFLFFGAPVGLLIRRGGFGAGFLSSLVIFAFYYILLLAGEGLADVGKLSAFWAMWLPNFILIPVAAELTSRVYFEKSLLRIITHR
jgi:lipopolysaccharide export system permease protein